jgi:hypothetical protein
MAVKAWPASSYPYTGFCAGRPQLSVADETRRNLVSTAPPHNGWTSHNFTNVLCAITCPRIPSWRSVKRRTGGLAPVSDVDLVSHSAAAQGTANRGGVEIFHKGRASSGHRELFRSTRPDDCRRSLAAPPGTGAPGPRLFGTPSTLPS